MTAKNDVTGDSLKTKAASENYRSGWDRIFGNKKDQPADKKEEDKNKKN